jgi:hypothetical protein
MTAVKMAMVAVELSLTKSAILTTFETDLRTILKYHPVVSGQINSDGDYLQANQMSTSPKINNLICLL